MKTMKNNINRAALSVIQTTEGRKNLGSAKWMSPRSFASLWMTILAMAAILSSCTQDDIAPAYSDAPLTITATVPGNVWGVATRAGEDDALGGAEGNTDSDIAVDGDDAMTASASYSEWTLHYTDHTDAPKTYTLTSVIEEGFSFSLTTGSDLVWAMVDATKEMHLTALCDNGTLDDTADDYTLHTSVLSATAGTALTFPAMKPTLAMLTVNFMLEHNLATSPTLADFAITVTAWNKAADYDPMTDGSVWPVAEGNATSTTFTLSDVPTADASNAYAISGTMLLPQQVMGKTLTVSYAPHTWTLDLSKVIVSGGAEGQTAHMLIAGQHLTLNLTAAILSVDSPTDILIEAFTAANAEDYENDLGGTAKKSNE